MENSEEILFGDRTITQIARDNRRKLKILQNAPRSCARCGGCCSHYKTVEVSPREENVAWLQKNGYLQPELAANGTHQMILDKDRRCIGLEGKVGELVNCSIYEHRPDACRQYVPGDAQCRTVILTDIVRCIK